MKLRGQLIKTETYINTYTDTITDTYSSGDKVLYEYNKHGNLVNKEVRPRYK